MVVSMSSDVVPFSEIEKALNEAIKSDGIVIKTTDYIFLLYELAPDRWVKGSWIFDERKGYKTTVSTKRAILYLIDEVAESLNRYKKENWKPIISPRKVKTIIEKEKM